MGQERGMTMDQEKMMLLKKYDHVWQRVMPDADPYAVLAEQETPVTACKEKAGEEWLLEKIEAEWKARAYYLTLARRGGVGSREFFRMAEEEEQHARRLKAMWYLAGRDLPREVFSGGCAVPQKKAEALRQRYGEECRSAEEYFALAKAAKGCTAEILRAMGEDERRHAETLLRILERMM